MRRRCWRLRCRSDAMAAAAQAPSEQRRARVLVARAAPDGRRPARRRGVLVAGRQASRLPKRARARQSLLPDLHRRSDDRPDDFASRRAWARRPARSSARAATRSCSRPRTTIPNRSNCRTTSLRSARRARSVATRGTTTPRWRSTPSRRRSKEIARLTNARGYDAEASYSPDGQWIVFSSMRDAYNRPLSDAEKKQLAVDPSFFGEIYIMRADGSGQRRLTNVNGYDGGPFFSPDGKRIVWRRFDEQGLIADVWTMNLDGSDQRQVDALRIDELGAIHSPLRRVSAVRVEQARVRELRSVHGRRRRHERAGAHHVLRRLRWPARAIAGWTQIAWTSSRGGGREGQIFLAQWNHDAARAALAARAAAKVRSHERSHSSESSAAWRSRSACCWAGAAVAVADGSLRAVEDARACPDAGVRHSSKGAWRDPQASGWPPTTSRAS